MARPGKNTSQSIKAPDRDQAIRSQGIVQAVINSRAPIEEWEVRARYGLRLQSYFASLLAGNKVTAPTVPTMRDPSAVCMGDT